MNYTLLMYLGIALWVFVKKQWKVEKLLNLSHVRIKITEYNKKTCMKFPKTIFWSALMKMCCVSPINVARFTIPFSYETCISGFNI